MTEAVVEQVEEADAGDATPKIKMPLTVKLTLHMREEINVGLKSRDERGKGPVGRLRRVDDMVPGVLYGHNQEGELFKVAAQAMERLLKRGAQNAILLVDIEGSTSGQRAVVKEIQYHKVLGNALHIDLLRVDPDETLRVSIPVAMQGTPEGVRAGGALQQSMSTIELECPASELPSGVEIDVTELEVGDSIHVSDLLEQEGRIVTEPQRTICTVLPPRLIEEETTDEEEEEEVEGVEGVEGEEAEEGEETPVAEGDVEAE